LEDILSLIAAGQNEATKRIEGLNLLTGTVTLTVDKRQLPPQNLNVAEAKTWDF
jgi:hypothetical protein